MAGSVIGKLLDGPSCLQHVRILLRPRLEALIYELVQVEEGKLGLLGVSVVWLVSAVDYPVSEFVQISPVPAHGRAEAG